MTRSAAIIGIEKYFDGGAFAADLARRVAIPTESQNPARRAELAAYLEAELQPSLARMGMSCRVLPNPSGNGGPLLVPQRIQNKKLNTRLMYRHCDRIRGPGREWG